MKRRKRRTKKGKNEKMKKEKKGQKEKMEKGKKEKRKRKRRKGLNIWSTEFSGFHLSKNYIHYDTSNWIFDLYVVLYRWLSAASRCC